MYSNAEETFRGDETISPVFAELPSRWIQVRSSQVEGGDVPVRLRTRDFCVSKTIPGLRGKKKRNKALKRVDPENDTGLFEVGFKSRQKKKEINTPNWATGALCSGIRRVRLLTHFLRINNGVINRICSTGHSPGQLLGYK